jgi:hypothetical protein
LPPADITYIAVIADDDLMRELKGDPMPAATT